MKLLSTEAACCLGQRRRLGPASPSRHWSPLLDPFDSYGRVRCTCDKYSAELGFSIEHVSRVPRIYMKKVRDSYESA